jgi:glycerol-1-phosphate dehydrogenase [NAD(P)+]
MRPADPIAELMAGTYPDPETGAPLRAETRALAIEDSLDGAELDVLAPLGLGRRLAVIADVDTAAALGDRVARAVASRHAVQRVTLDRNPHADAATLDRLLNQVEPADAIVAVGAGTINDLSKLVAHRRGIPQVVFATAPSMNGYTSVSASILEDGVKRSIRTATPAGAFFDLAVLAAAPAPLVRAGLGDAVCRATAQTDWRMQHVLLDRPYREAPFALLADDERALLADGAPAALLAGDVEAMRHLVRTIVLSGFGMTICGGSYPASQGEHLLAHYVSMRTDYDDLPPALHGAEIGVCTVAMTRLQRAVLEGAVPPRVKPSTITRAEILARFGPVAGESCWRELEPKLLDAQRADDINARLADPWDALRHRLLATSMPERELRAILAAAGAPQEPAELGWPAPLWDDARRHAREIRNRYTFLDLAADAHIAW